MTDHPPVAPVPPTASYVARLEGGPLDGLALTVTEALSVIELPAPPPRVPGEARQFGVRASPVMAAYALSRGARDTDGDVVLRYRFTRCRRQSPVG
jgi:hypothetical protein